MRKLFLLVCFIPFLSLSQTKLIAHKSAGGTNTNFLHALKTDAFLGNSNLGAAPTRFVTTAELDSVIFISNEKAVMVTSEICTEKKADTLARSIWREGKDTIYNHVLFSKQHALDSIKTVLSRDYNFQNDIDSTIFVGFDNVKKSEKSKQDSLSGDDFDVQESSVLAIEQPRVLPIWIGVLLFSIIGGFLYKFVRKTD